MNARRTVSKYFEGLLAALPALTVFSAKLIPLIQIFYFLRLVVTGHAELRKAVFWRELVRSRYAQITVLLLAWPLVTSWHSITPLRSVTTTGSMLLSMTVGAMTLLLIRRQPTMISPHALAGGLLVAILFPYFLILQEQAMDWHGLIRHWYMLKYEGLAYLDPYNEFMEKTMNRNLCVLVLMMWPTVYALLRIGRWKGAYALPLVVSPVLVLMQSTSALLAAVAGIAVFWLVRFMPRVMPRMLAGALVLFLLAWAMLFPFLFKAVGPHTEGFSELPRSAQHRLMIWDFTLDHAKQKPWIGWGMDTARSIPGGMEEFAPGLQWLPLHPHNSVLQLLLEQGIPGLLFTVAALVLVLRDWLRLCRADSRFGAATGAALFSYLIIGFMAFGLWQSWWIAAGWMAWMFLVQSMKEHKEANETNE